MPIGPGQDSPVANLAPPEIAKPQKRRQRRNAWRCYRLALLTPAAADAKTWHLPSGSHAGFWSRNLTRTDRT